MPTPIHSHDARAFAFDLLALIELAAAIVKGTKELSVADVQSKTRVGGHSADKACLTCSGARALHG